ncbi:hypothetical protein GUITHDRAFT_117338 [Guillardia theta CCMP2712]|uniref:Nucleotide-diphospho-sugar transferase domain-containing protein n=2 Tax=Guillardia theta TaxID=55529 RepID=L1IJN4_GUITC|nr:hypothetical protein GUITHDRAFT_117338 [Guillardia theta CCMP2712]EKX36446.1 hypothetical protein GUITHDRAFT_117338 [Guillardia theta CCMP2712]|eukprot:XP_005823426.1 hypothetical protein GUITHDRAFT_117338 [Guillardia theta CCMP2712]
MRGVHERTLVILSSNESKQEIMSTGSRVNAVTIPSLKFINKNLEFNTLGYRRLLRERIVAIQAVLTLKERVFLTEPDALWLSNLLEQNSFVNSDHDLVGFDDDNGFTGAGFMMIRRTLGSLCLWQTVLKRQTEILSRYAGMRDDTLTEDYNDQIFLNEVAGQMRASGLLTLKTMDSCDYRSGRWYKGNEWTPFFRCRGKVPHVINFNWVVGNAAKIQRAREHGHWFLEDDGKTCKPFHQTLAKAKTSFVK